MRFQHDLAGTDGRIRRTRNGVEFFAHQPTSRLERGDQASENIIRLRQMYQDHPGVHEVERSLRQPIPSDVVANDLEPRESQSVEEPGIDVRDEDSPRVADALAEPPCNRSTATAHFQAVPAEPQTPIQQMACRTRVEDCGQGGESRGSITHRIHHGASFQGPLGVTLKHAADSVILPTAVAKLRQQPLVEKLK
jgi:hypothetical protein